MEVLGYDNFFYYVWENISTDVVTDEFFDNNQEFLNEITYLFYDIYVKTSYIDEDDFITSALPTGRVTNIIEGIVSLIKKIGINE